MQKLYAVAYQRILNRLGQEALSPSRLPLILSDNNIREAGDFIYHRMPREELRQFIKNPCPVTSYLSFHAGSRAKIHRSSLSHPSASEAVSPWMRRKSAIDAHSRTAAGCLGRKAPGRL